MKKSDNKKNRVTSSFNDEDYGKRPRKALKTSKPPKRIRLQDLDFDDEE